MQKLLTTPVALILFTTLMYAQGVIPTAITAQHNLNRMSGSSGGHVNVLMEIPVSPPKVTGDVYLVREWQKGSVLMTSSPEVLSDLPIRYDLLREELEVNTEKGIKIIPANKLLSFAWETENGGTAYFINARKFTRNQVPLTGFVQILADGDLILVKSTSIELKKADYNVALDVGSHDHQYITKVKYYYTKNKELIPLPGTRKKLLAIFGDEKKPYTAPLRPRDEHDLVQLFNHYNQG